MWSQLLMNEKGSFSKKICRFVTKIGYKSYPASLSKSKNPWNFWKDSSMLSRTLSSSSSDILVPPPPSCWPYEEAAFIRSGDPGDLASNNCTWCFRRLLSTSSSMTRPSADALARLTMYSLRLNSSISTCVWNKWNLFIKVKPDHMAKSAQFSASRVWYISKYSWFIT